MYDTNAGFEKTIYSEKTALFQLYENSILCVLDENFAIIEYNPFAHCFFRKLTHEPLEQKNIWTLFQAFSYPLASQQFSSPVALHYPLLGQHHQLSSELGLCWNLCPMFNPKLFLFMAELYQHSPTDIKTKALILSEKKAQQENQSKLEFLANMSHELRNSLNGILGMTQILSMRNLAADTQDYVRDIYQCGNHLLSLVSDMLDFAKLEGGQLTIQHEPFNIRKLIGDIVSQQSKQSHQHNVDIFVDYHNDIPRHVLGDPNRIRQIMLNLINNAMKFTTSGHISVSVELLEKAEDTAKLQFIIEDTGIGIPEEKIDDIFNRYTQVRQTDATVLKGSGLGLAIVKQLIEKMHGSIGVKSILGQGTTFWFNLPFTLQKKQVESINWGADFPQLKVLIVDDNAQRAKAILKQINGEKNRATKGATSLDVLYAAAHKHDAYDIVLIDDQIKIDIPIHELIHQINTDKLLQNTMICGLIQEKNREKYNNSFFYEMIKPLHPSAFVNNLAQTWSRWEIDLKIKKVQKTIRSKAIKTLLVEDNPMSQKVAMIMLQEFGCQVTLAENAQEALKKLDSTSCFDILFLDIGLPDISGYDLAKKIRENITPFSTIPIIALTAHALENDKTRCTESGISDVLVKPISFDTTKEILLKWINKDDIQTST